MVRPQKYWMIKIFWVRSLCSQRRSSWVWSSGLRSCSLSVASVQVHMDQTGNSQQAVGASRSVNASLSFCVPVMNRRLVDVSPPLMADSCTWLYSCNMTWMEGCINVQSGQTLVAYLAFKGLSLLLMVDHTLPCVYKDDIWLGEHGPINASFLSTKTSHPRGFWSCRNEPTLILDGTHLQQCKVEFCSKTWLSFEAWQMAQRENKVGWWQRQQARMRAINYRHLTAWRRMSCPTNQFIRGQKTLQDIWA